MCTRQIQSHILLLTGLESRIVTVWLVLTWNLYVWIQILVCKPKMVLHKLIGQTQEKQGRIRMKTENHFVNMSWVWVMKQKNGEKIEKLGQLVMHMHCKSKENNVIKTWRSWLLFTQFFCPVGIYFLEQSHNARLGSCSRSLRLFLCSLTVPLGMQTSQYSSFPDLWAAGQQCPLF